MTKFWEMSSIASKLSTGSLDLFQNRNYHTLLWIDSKHFPVFPIIFPGIPIGHGVTWPLIWLLLYLHFLMPSSMSIAAMPMSRTSEAAVPGPVTCYILCFLLINLMTSILNQRKSRVFLEKIVIVNYIAAEKKRGGRRARHRPRGSRCTC